MTGAIAIRCDRTRKASANQPASDVLVVLTRMIRADRNVRGHAARRQAGRRGRGSSSRLFRRSVRRGPPSGVFKQGGRAVCSG